MDLLEYARRQKLAQEMTHEDPPENPWEKYGKGLVDYAVGMIPVYGPGRDAVKDIQNGDYGSGAMNAAMAGMDASSLGGSAVIKALLAKGLPGFAGSMTDVGKNKLGQILSEFENGATTNPKIFDAIKPTAEQRSLMQSLLQRDYKGIEVPEQIPYKPRHAYDSRVGKDGFSVDDLKRWSISAADDSASVVDHNGRIAFRNHYFDQSRNTDYPVRMPIRGDARGNVWVDDVIPEGIFGPNSRKLKK